MEIREILARDTTGAAARVLGAAQVHCLIAHCHDNMHHRCLNSAALAAAMQERSTMAAGAALAHLAGQENPRDAIVMLARCKRAGHRIAWQNNLGDWCEDWDD